MQRLSSATAASWEICRQCSVLDSQQSTNLPWSCNRCRYFSPHNVTCWWFPLFVYNVIAVCSDHCTEISVHMNEKCSLRELFRKTTLSSNIWASSTTIMHSDEGLYIRGLHSVLTTTSIPLSSCKKTTWCFINSANCHCIVREGSNNADIYLLTSSPLITNHRLPGTLNLQAGGPWLCRFRRSAVTSIITNPRQRWWDSTNCTDHQSGCWHM